MRNNGLINQSLSLGNAKAALKPTNTKWVEEVGEENLCSSNTLGNNQMLILLYYLIILQETNGVGNQIIL